MAFGTGIHETTSLCIRLMEDYLEVLEMRLEHPKREAKD